MIIVTGAAGFIGSCLVGKLNAEGYNDIVMVDDFSAKGKRKNWESKSCSAMLHRNDFHQWLRENHLLTELVFHLGARTDTTEFDTAVFDELNLNYSKEVWNICVEFGLPLIYASSAATYGLGELGYEDDHEVVGKLKPLNPYGVSKNDFDKWAIGQKRSPYFWAGLKFFNVYGPNEYHKGRMASVVYHAFNQIRERGKVKLFRSHRKNFEDGKQLRDFVYVKDVVNVCYFLMHHRRDSGLYNLGTGEARSFLDLADSTFRASDKNVNIEFIDTPQDIRDKYQYFTEANIGKLRAIGYHELFFSLEEGIEDYVQNYLLHGNHF